MTEEREAVVKINDITLDTITAMMHFIYTGELGDEDLNILDVAHAADKYILPGWIEELYSKLSAQEVTEEMVADMVNASSGYPGARMLGREPQAALPGSLLTGPSECLLLESRVCPNHSEPASYQVRSLDLSSVGVLMSIITG